ncbi:GIY-YIG nuclease family protein [Candidatus Fermentibacteria bacterium]|nr:GIY-YIG nuclease family protein [Candidatus Fermentibacteria bacterium]
MCDRDGELYTGITTDIRHRMKQHKAQLLYSESHSCRESAASRERQIKGWTRKKKLALVSSSNQQG